MKILVARRANHNISKLVVIISRPEKLRISYISFFLITHPVNLFLYKFASSENRDVSIRRRASHFYNDANFSLFTWEGREGEVQQKRNGSILFFRPKLRRFFDAPSVLFERAVKRLFKGNLKRKLYDILPSNPRNCES